MGVGGCILTELFAVRMLSMPESPEPPPPSATDHGSPRPYGSGYDGVGFHGIGGELLRTFPPLTTSPVESPKPEIPFVPAVHGSQLVAPIQAGVDGFRISSCPVCLTHSVLPKLAGGWVPLRCDSCGSEFVASDGSPPPPASVAKPAATVKTVTAGSRFLSLILLGDGGKRLARCPTCHALESVPLAGNRVDMRCQSCGTEFTASSSLAGSLPPPPPPPPRTAPPPPARPAAPVPVPSPVAITDTVRTATDGTRSVVCPLCRRFSVSLPRVLPTFTITVTCPGCRRPFTVNLRRAMKKPVATKPPPPSSRRKSRWRSLSWRIAFWMLVVIVAVVWTALLRDLIKKGFFGD